MTWLGTWCRRCGCKIYLCDVGPRCGCTVSLSEKEAA